MAPGKRRRDTSWLPTVVPTVQVLVDRGDASTACHSTTAIAADTPPYEGTLEGLSTSSIAILTPGQLSGPNLPHKAMHRTERATDDEVEVIG
jgi:hypothetical protein